ncbi:MAG: Mpo1-like protein [Pirellulaceae bacterium]
MPKKTPDQWFEEYGESHQNHTNKLVHWICVPAITVSLLGLLWSIPTPDFSEQQILLNWATLFIALVLVYYVWLSIPLAVGMLFFTSGIVGLIYLHEKHLALELWQTSVGIFVLAWIGQFIGHQVEGKKPSFFQDVQFLLIGPLWLLGFIYRRLGIKY